jgi:hypothetical protein
MQWIRDPMSFEVPVAEMLKNSWGAFTFCVSGFDSRCSGGATPCLLKSR